MLDLLHAGVRDGVDHFHQQFASAQPFRHVVLDPFLDASFCQELVEGFPPFDQKFAVNEHGEAGRHAVHSDLAKMGAAYNRFDRLMSDRAFLALISRITGIPEVLYDPEYVGGGTHDNLDGEELDSHVDFNYHPRTHLHRRLNLIVFLNPEWEDSWGGCLELMGDPLAADAQRTSFVPTVNRAVIFETTEYSWHGFERIRIPPGRNTSRRSIAVYFYTKERPAQETAPSHATFYYQRPLPAHLKAGYALRSEDVMELQSLLTRRDTQLQFLYHRELEFSKSLGDATKAIEGLNATVASVLGSASFRIGRAITWPVRALKKLV
jgi:hypothetical protein